ncbi:MAG: glycoside hydrolase family 18 protein [Bacteroidota bacterium]|nr:glycoside hydrolase family 18 protein [Bacteroidota bacterium]
MSITALSQAQKKWITAYYPLWAVPTLYPESVDYASVTHIVHFCANPVMTSPYLDVLIQPVRGGYNQDSVNIQWGGVYNGNNPPLWRTVDIQQTLISKAHDNKVKVLLSVGGIFGDGAKAMSYIAEDVDRINTFVVASCAYAKRKGYDGIELDWEFPRDHERNGYKEMIKRFRKELDAWPGKGLFVTAVNHTPWSNLGYEKEAMISNFDQINVMTYEMYGGNYQNVKTGYSSPLELSVQYSGYNGYAINQQGRGLKAWIEYGIPASKLGLSISFLTTEFYNVKPPVQPAQSFGWHNWGYVKNIPTEGRHWDPVSLVPWQASGSTFITFEDTVSVRLKVEYAKQLDLGGVMIYDLLGGYIPDAPGKERHQLLKSVTRSMQKGEPVPNKK